VPKKSKEVQTESANGSRSWEKKPAAKKAATKSVRARKKTPAKSRLEAKSAPPTDEQIRLRAYFIAEQRAQGAIDGDHNSDWLEAKRQLFEEAGLPSR
jgi:Protein of unknown function (DUF2934)